MPSSSTVFARSTRFLSIRWVMSGSDAGISGAKGRNGRPGLDSMLKDASRRKFDIAMAWAIDRLGRSLSDLLDTIQHLEACGVDLYLDQQAIDTTTPMGKLVSRRLAVYHEGAARFLMADLNRLMLEAARNRLWEFSFAPKLRHGSTRTCSAAWSRCAHWQCVCVPSPSTRSDHHKCGNAIGRGQRCTGATRGFSGRLWDRAF
jgi:Resolvase, N terminal domain